MTLGAIVIPIFGVIVGVTLLYLSWRFVRRLSYEHTEPNKKHDDDDDTPANDS